MSSKKKYNWNEPSLFPDDQQHPANMEFQGYKIVTNKNGETQRLAIIRRTKEDFIRKSQAIWGDQYDYSESVYAGSKSPITIRCKKHNHYFTVPFAQNHYIKPHGNVKPTGCDLCSAEALGYYPKNRGPHHIRTKEERRRDEEEKARRREERKQRAEQRKYEHSEEARQKRQQEQQAYIDRWQAKDINEARFKERVFQMYGDQYDMSLVDYQGNDKEVTLICRHHGLFEIKPRILLVGISHGGVHKPPHGCWKCCGLQDPLEKPVLTAKDFNQKVRRIYQYKPLTFPIKKKISLSANVTATCAKHGKITHKAQWWLDGNGCEYCNGKWYAPHWKDYARRVHGDKYEYVGDAPVKQTDYIHYICPTHGLQEQEYRVHVGLGCGCPKCANYPNKKTPLERCNEWIAKCEEKYEPGRYDYSRAHETYVNNDSLVWIRCCIHNKWFQTTPDNNLRTVHGSCPICSIEFRESEGEATIRRWLLKHDITNFKFDEVTIPNENPKCKRQYLRPDFWLPDYNLFIEYNGEEHYEDIDFFFDEEFTFEDEQIRDETMRQYCRDHHHNLLEIPYWDFNLIAEILSDVLLKGKTDYSTYYVNQRLINTTFFPENLKK